MEECMASEYLSTPLCPCHLVQTKGMTIELLSYNPELHILGYLNVELEWASYGSIEAVFKISGLPALDYLTSSDSTLSSLSKASQFQSFPEGPIAGRSCFYPFFH